VGVGGRREPPKKAFVIKVPGGQTRQKTGTWVRLTKNCTERLVIWGKDMGGGSKILSKGFLGDSFGYLRRGETRSEKKFHGNPKKKREKRPGLVEKRGLEKIWDEGYQKEFTCWVNYSRI